MSREIIHFQSEALGPVSALRSGEAVAFLGDALKKNLPGPLWCRFADASAMDRFFQRELLPAMEAWGQQSAAPHAVFCEFQSGQSAADTLIEALRELFPEVVGLGIVEGMPLEVAIALIAKGPAARGRILVLAGMNLARERGEAEWRQVRAALGTLARLAGVRVILGSAGPEEAQAPRRRARKVPRVIRPSRQEPEGELFRGRKRPGLHIRGAHGIATAFVSALLLGTAGLAVLWLTVSARPEDGMRLASQEGSRPESREIVSVAGGPGEGSRRF